MVETLDRRGATLVFKLSFIKMEKQVLLDFRLSRGCGIEFKRHFAKIRENSAAIIIKAPILWPSLVPVQAIPDLP